jgi:hypothetical protein
LEALKLAHFRGHESKQYAFFQVPKLLVTDNRFKPVSNDAKLLYSLMLDRMQLSIKSGWMDNDGHVFIFYPQQNAADDLNCSVNTITALYKELDAIGLIVRKRQGQGRPDMIYVMNFASETDSAPENPPPQSAEFQNPNNCDSRPTARGNPESQNLGFKTPKTCDSRFTEDSRKPKSGTLESQDLGFKNPNSCDSLIRKNKTDYNKTDFINLSGEAPADFGQEEKGEREFEKIDRDELIRLSGSIVSPQHAAIMADEVLEAYRLLWQEKDEKTLRLLKASDTATLAGFISEVSRMDLSHVGNLTAYLKRVLADYLRKNSLRGVAPPARQEQSSSYDLKEIQEWLDRGGDFQ